MGLQCEPGCHMPVYDRINVKSGKRGAIVPVVVTPRASKSEVVGVHDGALKIRLAAPPVDGAANEELKAALAKFLGVPKSSVSITGGRTSKRKTVCIEGIEPGDVIKALGS